MTVNDTTEHIAEPGLIVLDITAGNEETVRTAMRQLEHLWRTSGIVPVRRVPGQPGITARLYADLRNR